MVSFNLLKFWSNSLNFPSNTVDETGDLSVKKAFCKLIDILYNKGLLTLDEKNQIVQILDIPQDNDYNNDNNENELVQISENIEITI